MPSASTNCIAVTMASLPFIYGDSFLRDAVFTAAILWVRFTSARFVNHDRFDKCPGHLTLLDSEYELIIMLVLALTSGRASWCNRCVGREVWV